MNDPGELQALMAMAERAMDQAHAPWSRLQVGAAVLAADGGSHAGCNVESAAFPLGGCAERHAIAAAVLAGGTGTRLRAVAIAARDGNGRGLPIPPCGACRQLIHEFGRDALVGWRTDGEVHWHAIRALLPEAFELPPQ